MGLASHLVDITVHFWRGLLSFFCCHPDCGLVFFRTGHGGTQEGRHVPHRGADPLPCNSNAQGGHPDRSNKPSAIVPTFWVQLFFCYGRSFLLPGVMCCRFPPPGQGFAHAGMDLYTNTHTDANEDTLSCTHMCFFNLFAQEGGGPTSYPNCAPEGGGESRPPTLSSPYPARSCPNPTSVGLPAWAPGQVLISFSKTPKSFRK